MPTTAAAALEALEAPSWLILRRVLSIMQLLLLLVLHLLLDLYELLGHRRLREFGLEQAWRARREVGHATPSMDLTLIAIPTLTCTIATPSMDAIGCGTSRSSRSP